MKKFLSLILVMLTILSMLASCGLNDKKEKEEQAKDAKDAYTRNGEKIIFGSYPQSEVTDEALKAQLNSKAGELPTADNSQAWSKNDYMWYIDVEEGEEKYRGVYFTAYRYCSTWSNSSAEVYQRENGYLTGNVYWFKYEPISWSISSENEDDGTAVLICDSLLDSQPLSTSGVVDYSESSLRKWLNETFYNTAFSKDQKNIIITTAPDKVQDFSGVEEDMIADLKAVKDKVFVQLPPYDVKFTEVEGFLMDKKATKYALSQGVSVIDKSTGICDYCTYWGGVTVRSNVWAWDFEVSSGMSHDEMVQEANRMYNELVANTTSGGIIPVLKIKLK